MNRVLRSVFRHGLPDSNRMRSLRGKIITLGSVALLASSAGDWITGQNIVVDGGWSIW